MPLSVPVKVRHEGDEHEALTRDLSSTGIFLYSETGMKAGSKLELVIMLPPGLGLGPGGWTLCEASVVRVEEFEGKGMGVPLLLIVSISCRRSAEQVCRRRFFSI